MTIHGAAERAMKLVSQRLFLFVMPIAVVSLSFRALTWALHRVIHGKGLWVEFVLIFSVWIPLGLFAEAIVSAMYLRMVKGEESGWRQGAEVARYPGAGGIIARLSAMCCCWIAPTLVIALVLSIPLKALFQLGRSGRHVGFSIAGGDHWWVVVWLILYVASLSRYSFVMPMLAVRRMGGGEVFRSAVRQTKGYLGVLATIAIGQCLVQHFIYKSESSPQMGHGWTQIAGIVSSLVGSVLSAYAVGFSTELAVTSNATDS